MKIPTQNSSPKSVLKNIKDISKSPVIQKKLDRATAIISQLENPVVG